jgi:Ca2+-binding EF-hand superfamily protein
MNQLSKIVLGIVFGLMMVERAGAQNAPAQKAPAKNVPTKKPGEKSARVLQFQRLDASRDGKLDAEEFAGGSVGKAADVKRQELAECDLNKDGSLDFEEFKKRGNKPPDRSKLTDDFKQRDKDSNGNLTQKEFVGNRAGTEMNNAKATFVKLDLDGDDQVSQQEFVERGGKKKASPKSARYQRRQKADRSGVHASQDRQKMGAGGKRQFQEA